MSRPTLYVAGRMRGQKWYAFHEFFSAEAHLVELGYSCVNPARIDVENGFDARTFAATYDWDSWPEGLDQGEVIDRDLAALRECDGIYLLHGWRDSLGANAEHAVASWRGLDIYEEGVLEPPKLGTPLFTNAWERDPRPINVTVFMAESYHPHTWNPPDTSSNAGHTCKETNPKDRIGTTKSPTSYIPSGPLREVGLALLEGAIKYGAWNWRDAGARGSVYYDAVGRHMDAWKEGEDIDPASGIHHLMKAAAGLIVIRDSQLVGNWVDDRPTKVYADGWLEALNAKAKALVEASNKGAQQ